MENRALAAGELNIPWQDAEAEVVRILQRLIQIDTRNPPGNEIEAARYLEALLTAEGIETKLFEPFPGRGAVIARIPGSGALRPVMLLAHMDVVAVEPAHWSVDPFAGVVSEGFLYGRGAIDDKGMLAVNALTMLLLQRHVVRSDTRLSRDVVFVATSDEEAGGTYGLQWLLDHQRERLHAEFALNEGGRLRVVNGRLLYAAIQTAEKVSHIVRVRARGPSGHASVPLAGNAVARLGRAIALIAEHREPVQLLPTTRRFFERLAGVWPDVDQAQAMAQLSSGDGERTLAAAAALSAVPVFNAVLRTGISPTIVRGGTQFNVIPAEADAVLCVRTLPGAPVHEVVERMRTAVGDPQIEISVEDEGADAPESSFDSPLFRAVEAAVHALAPGVVTVPYLSTGATDSARLRRAGVEAFGLLPFPLEEADERRMHGHDERIGLRSLAFGSRLVFDTVLRVAS